MGLSASHTAALGEGGTAGQSPARIGGIGGIGIGGIGGNDWMGVPTHLTTQGMDLYFNRPGVSFVII